MSKPETLLQGQIIRALERLGVWVLRLNAGQRGGVRMAPAGTPDLLLVGPGRLAGCWLEVKTAEGEPSKKQLEWYAKARRMGVRHAVVRSSGEAARCVLAWRAGVS